ncbi:MAG TPA: hypothetical protein DDY98_03310 [Ruminococcaceae bacterium]|nr:hypothetical protein [Oscillospiraceae bacterium]
MIFYLLSFVIAGAAFAFGVARLFRKKKPLYFQLLVCAVGCFAIRQLFDVVSYFCGGFAYEFNIGMLGIFGCVFFLLSANYGQLDRIVDDGSDVNKRAKTVAWAAPAVLAVIIVGVFLAWKDRELVNAVLWVIMLVPAIPASYFNWKHLIMPMDDFGFLRATRVCNVIAFSFYLVTAFSVISLAEHLVVLSYAANVVMSLLMFALAFFADKGAKQWGI